MRSAVLTLTVAALTGCGGPTASNPLGPNGAAVQAGGVSLARAVSLANPRLLYLSNDTDVMVYPANQNNPPAIRTITSGVNEPEGLAVDSSGTLYVANNTGNDITEYRSGQSTPFRTISNGIDDPEGIAVDAEGTLYVSNRNLGQQEVYVTEYERGSLSPNLTITFPKHNLPHIGGLAVDSTLNLYVLTVLDKVTVTKFPPGSTQGTDLGLQDIGSSGDGLAVDGAGNLYVAVATGAINVYAPGATQPKRTIRNGLTSPAFFVVTPPGALYVPNQASGANGSVLEFPANRNRARFMIDGFEYPKGVAVY